MLQAHRVLLALLALFYLGAQGHIQLFQVCKLLLLPLGFCLQLQELDKMSFIDEAVDDQDQLRQKHSVPHACSPVIKISCAVRQ